ncbi:AMP-binding protein [Sphingomonas sp.]|uniref:AMP-binding protein n=1 Tax=Sphingomonas sp. TaxID=28214 RepID=UPI001B2620CD|nr:AMP-binding protein [Sphingomonas sp.]MBO9712279.1 AMP-binding protein [Sphingomonas sp.]
MNILQAFADRVAAHPERIAIVDGKGRATTYAQLDARGAALAARWHAQGLREGDRVLLALPLNAGLYAALAALWRIGAAAVLPEPALGLFGLRHAVAATRPKALLASGLYRLLPLLGDIRAIPLRLSMHEGEGSHPVGDFALDTPALISFTSGSSGAPKAIVRSHAFLAAQDRAVAPLIATHGKPETDLVAFPVFVVANLGQGITSVLPNWPVRRPARAKGAAIRAHAERHGVTRLLLSPAIAETLADHLPRDAHSLFTGGGPVFPDLIATLLAAKPGLRVVAVYGSTEAEPIAEIDADAIADADWQAMREGAGLLAGHPAGVRVRIEADEIQVAGDHVVQGYLDSAHDASTKVRDGDGTVWHRTGDGGCFDEQGRLWLRGRVSARIGAHWPFEVEAPARFWPGVRRAALGRGRDGPVLAIEGDARHLAEWRAAARLPVVHLPRIPVDRRHGSKVDQAALEAMLGKR